MKKKIKFKKMKSLLLIVLLITNTICADDCTSLSTENTCKEKTGCKWKAATCSGDSSCTSKTTSESVCKDTTYTEKIKCTYTAAVIGPGTCNGDNVCTQVTNLDDDSACVAQKYGGTPCEYTEAVTGENPSPATCTGNAVCEAVTELDDNSVCIATFYGQTPCTYTAGAVTKAATCTGDAGTTCSSATPLTSPTACESTEYDGNPKNCVYAAGSCTADTTQETEETEDTENPGKTDTSGSTNNGGDTSNTEKDNSEYIKFSLLFSLLYLLF